jgi:hypothetical protein
VAVEEIDADKRLVSDYPRIMARRNESDVPRSKLSLRTVVHPHLIRSETTWIKWLTWQKHLAQVSLNHNALTRKQHPTISDFNEVLESTNVLDTLTRQLFQR